AVRDGAFLPILHLNGYKIAIPTILSRLSDSDLTQLFTGYGYKPYFVEGHEAETVHQLMAGTLDTIITEIRVIQSDARAGRSAGLPLWPMIILRTSKDDHRSEEHTSELQSHLNLVCRLLLEKKKKIIRK